MGTSLTGLTPSTTYDALIKVGDNGPLSATAKYIGDGLGNDSVLALSTTAVGIGTSTPSQLLDVQGNSAAVRVAEVGGSEARLVSGGSSSFVGTYSDHPLLILTNSGEKMRITSAGNVGIGTSTPTRQLTVVTAAGVAGEFRNDTTAAAGTAGYGLIVQSEASGASSYNAVFRDLAETQTYMVIKTQSDQDGYVGINTFNPAVHLDVVGQIRANTGILFGTDTAAANALDDYEEGTWTPSVAFGGASVGLTYGRRGGTYTKIGRQVTICGDLILSAKGSSTGNATITGLPFTINGSSTDFLQAVSFRFAEMSFSGMVQGYGGVGTTLINMEQVTSGANATALTHADFEDGTQLMVSLTYFV